MFSENLRAKYYCKILVLNLNRTTRLIFLIIHVMQTCYTESDFSWNGIPGILCIYWCAAHFNKLCCLRLESVLNFNRFSLDICIFREAECKAELTFHEVSWVSLRLTYLEPGRYHFKTLLPFNRNYNCECYFPWNCKTIIFFYLLLEIITPLMQTIQINSVNFKAIFTHTTAVSIVSICLDRFVRFSFLSGDNLTLRYIIG
jgi:hypothetical protein